MEHLIANFADFLRLHLISISVGIVTTLFTIYGESINNIAQKVTKNIPFLGRFAFFVVLCTVGYAFLSSQAARFLRHLLEKASDIHLILIIIGTFLLLAFLAKSNKSIK